MPSTSTRTYCCGAPRSAKPETVPGGPLCWTVTPGRSASWSCRNGPPVGLELALGQHRDGGAGRLGGGRRAVGRDDDVGQHDGLGAGRRGERQRQDGERANLQQAAVSSTAGRRRGLGGRSPLRSDRTSARPARRLGERQGRSPGSRVSALAPRLPGGSPSGIPRRRLAAYSCGGSRGISPRSLFIPSVREP